MASGHLGHRCPCYVELSQHGLLVVVFQLLDGVADLDDQGGLLTPELLDLSIQLVHSGDDVGHLIGRSALDPVAVITDGTRQQAGPQLVPLGLFPSDDDLLASDLHQEVIGLV